MVGDEIFEGEAEFAVPATVEEYHRKMPGHADSNGDHCVS